MINAEAVSDEAWADYLYYRENPKGEHRERWLHNAGCRQWFNIARDTITHHILAVYEMGVAMNGEGPPATTDAS